MNKNKYLIAVAFILILSGCSSKKGGSDSGGGDRPSPVVPTPIPTPAQKVICHYIKDKVQVSSLAACDQIIVHPTRIKKEINVISGFSKDQQKCEMYSQELNYLNFLKQQYQSESPNSEKSRELMVKIQKKTEELEKYNIPSLVLGKLDLYIDTDSANQLLTSLKQSFPNKDIEMVSSNNTQSYLEYVDTHMYSGSPYFILELPPSFNVEPVSVTLEESISKVNFSFNSSLSFSLKTNFSTYCKIRGYLDDQHFHNDRVKSEVEHFINGFFLINYREGGATRTNSISF